MSLKYLDMTSTFHQKVSVFILMAYHLLQLVSFSLILSPHSRKTEDPARRKRYHFSIGVTMWMILCLYIVFVYQTIRFREVWGVYEFYSHSPKFNNMLIYWFRLEVLMLPIYAIYSVVVSNLYLKNRRQSSF